MNNSLLNDVWNLNFLWHLEKLFLSTLHINQWFRLTIQNQNQNQIQRLLLQPFASHIIHKVQTNLESGAAYIFNENFSLKQLPKFSDLKSFQILIWKLLNYSKLFDNNPNILDRWMSNKKLTLHLDFYFTINRMFIS